MPLYRYFREHDRRYAAGFLFLLITNVFALLIPWVMKLAVEGLQNSQHAHFSPLTCSTAIVLLAVAACAARIFSRTFILNAARIIEFDIRNRLFRNLMQQDALFFSRGKTGDIISRFSNDLTNVRMLVGFGFMSAVNTFILYTAAVSLMIRIHPGLTLFAILPFPLMVLLVKRVSRHIFQRSIDAQESLARLSGLVEESARASVLIKAYCREKHFRALFEDVSSTCLSHNLKLARLRGLLVPVMATTTGAGTLIVLFTGGRLVISGALTLGDFVAFSGYLAMLVWPTAVMGWILTLMQRGAASMSRLNTLLETPPSARQGEDSDLKDIRHGIEARNLSFRYGEEVVLRDISFSLRSGERLGITGSVGSGKTTLLRLLLRLLPPPDGTLFVDGIDINRIPPSQLRNLMGYVPQEPFLFSRSIADNVAFGSADSESVILEAVKNARFLNDVERFREKMATVVGERGVTLSGGQKQRLSIARALARNPSLLILDDPLSAVDAGNEEEILTNLDTLAAGRTFVIVSQRISALNGCDRIIVLDDGRIVETGAPAELLERGGRYAELCQMQLLRDELSGNGVQFAAAG